MLEGEGSLVSEERKDRVGLVLRYSSDTSCPT